MSRNLDETHDPSARSWIPSANEAGADFPVQNLPFGIFRRRGVAGAPHAGLAIGDRILDLHACKTAGLLTGAAAKAAACGSFSLNALAALGRESWAALRSQAFRLLTEGEGEARVRSHGDWETRLVPAREACELFLPAEIGDYTDFYASVHHATNVGRLFRPDQPLLPNYKHVPIGYHGRASSVVASGTPVRRPRGQVKADDSAAPVFAPSKVLDYEAELGFLVGPGNPLGTPVPLAAAEDHLLGVCLLNDWSARDIQKWEYQPLGPFLAKSFATTLSPWVVTFEALAPFRAPFQRPDGDPAPLPYLDPGERAPTAGLAVTLEVLLLTPRMRERGESPWSVSRGSSRDLYWTPGQLLAHHTSNGCNLRSGDLLGSGTISGPERENEGSLLERTRGGKEPLTLPNGETRRFLEDGDEVILRGWCEAEGFRRIGLGECRGIVLPALPVPP